MSRVVDERRAAGALHREALRRMVQPKNREKGSWSDVGLRDLVHRARVELAEVEEAMNSGESAERIIEELGDVAAFVAMALDVAGAPCCCEGEAHLDHCPGWFVNQETHELERCDECATFAGDDDVAAFFDAVHAKMPCVESDDHDHHDSEEN